MNWRDPKDSDYQLKNPTYDFGTKLNKVDFGTLLFSRFTLSPKHVALIVACFVFFLMLLVAGSAYFITENDGVIKPQANKEKKNAVDGDGNVQLNNQKVIDAMLKGVRLAIENVVAESSVNQASKESEPVSVFLANNDGLLKENAELSRLNEIMKVELQENKLIILNLQRELIDSKTLVVGLNSDVINLQQELQEEKERFLSKLTAIENNLGGMGERNESLSLQIGVLEDDIAKLQKEKIFLESQTVELKTTNDDLKGLYTALVSQTEELKSNVVFLENENRVLELKSKQLKRIISSLEVNGKDLESKTVKLKSDISSLGEQRNLLRLQSEKLMKKIAELNVVKNNLISENESLRDKL